MVLLVSVKTLVYSVVAKAIMYKYLIESLLIVPLLFGFYFRSVHIPEVLGLKCSTNACISSIDL